MNRWIKRLCLCCLLCIPAWSNAADSGLGAAREKIMGPPIATTPGYTVHSPQAVKTAAGYACGAPAAGRMSEAEYSAQRTAIEEAARKESEIASSELARLMSKQNNPSFVKDAAYVKEVNEASQRNSAVTTRMQEKMAQLEKRWRESRAASVNALTLYLQHTPSDPDQTIVPLQGQAPSSTFVADLNRVLRPFLQTCPDSEWVSTAHYYRDDIPFGMTVTDTLEPHIIAFPYSLRVGTLTLKPEKVASEVQRINKDPARNPRLTLAGLREANAALTAESSRRSASYRKDQELAARRQPGVVYKLDPYWSRYRKPDLARRIFDGDFGQDAKSASMIHGGDNRYADTADFRMLFVNYANLYSERCKAHVESWVTLAEQTRVNHRSEQDPVTGLFESRSDPKTVTYQIDARFAGLYQRYEADLQQAYMAKVLGQMKAAGRGEQKRPSEMTAADFKAAVRQQTSDMMDFAGVFPDFFDNHACTSATMTQLGENILRAAQSRPSLQQDGVKLPSAAQESDPPLR